MSRIFFAVVLLVILPISTFSSGCCGAGVSRHHSAYRHQRLQYQRLQQIKGDIVKKLGFSVIPSVEHVNISLSERQRKHELYTRRIADNKEVRHLYGHEDKLAKKFYSFPANSLPDGVSETDWFNSYNLRVYTPLDVSVPHQLGLTLGVVSAHINLLLNPDTCTNHRLNYFTLGVYQLLGTPTQGRRVGKRLLATRYVGLDVSGWVSVDIGEAVSTWLDEPTTNHGLEISAEVVCHSDGDIFSKMRTGTHDTPSTPSTPTIHPYTPYIDVTTQVVREQLYARDHRSPMSRDDGDDCREESNATHCCRYAMWVDFEAIGWDSWIASPPGFQAYYCDGRCPFRRFKPAYGFTVLQSSLERVNDGRSPYAEPCCVAGALGALTIQHLDDSDPPRLEISQLDDMVIERCACA